MTPKPWTRNAMKSHMGAARQRLFSLRDDLLTATTDGDGTRMAHTVKAIADHLRAEEGWLRSLEPVPDDLTTSARAHFAASYGSQLVETSIRLTEAVRTPPTPRPPDDDEPTGGPWDAFGLSLLQLLAFDARRI